mgnify:CR=1 FL=1
MSHKSRHLERFMPYASDRQGLVIRDVRVAVDDSPRGELASGYPLSTGSEPWERLTLSVSLERRTALTRVLHPDELGEPPVAVVLAVRCPATFLSRPHCIKHPDPGTDKYEHVVTLHRHEIRGEVSFTPFLVRTAAHARSSGLASRKGAWLAKGDPWFLHVDETKPRQGNNLEILRKRFSEVPGIAPADHHNWFALQLDGAAPRLYLNDDHTTLMRVLYDTSTRGKRAVLRDALFDQIDAAVWPALLIDAARAWADSGDDTYPWRVNILRLWVKWRTPEEHDLDAGVQQLVQHALHDPAQFLLEINAVLQRRDQPRHLERLLAEVSP